MSEPRRGILASVRLGYASSGRGLGPDHVEHAQLGITWDVPAIFGCGQHPGRAGQWLGKATLTKWWLLKVSGPLPAHPAERGEFVMQVSRYGDQRLWWITVNL